MKIIVDRYKSDDNATLSRIFVFDGDQEVYACFGLEDEYRDVKVRGETRIPAGRYNVGIRKEGGFHSRYMRKAATRDIHRGMLHILDVPGFEYILIHIGNFETDTAGCLLVGRQANERGMYIEKSVSAYRGLYSAVIGAAERGDLTIEFQDNDR
ncbi:DUF5675 family protein [Hyphococcus flavus]|uniref:DUF5675 family protein n=1 Tax=Hyphococcus flavus TaxID=1866326 RepID=A0AAE9ZIH3_9PROT|nr:DUF5675 family protein [Hyphococcus flavus]WDI31581.1 DUF5675 family protein [Hyphococcus flavus]